VMLLLVDLCECEFEMCVLVKWVLSCCDEFVVWDVWLVGLV